MVVMSVIIGVPAAVWAAMLWWDVEDKLLHSERVHSLFDGYNLVFVVWCNFGGLQVN
jgi:hypothetical protein